MVDRRPSHLLEMVSILSWNVRGLNAPNKQKEIKLLCNEERVGLIGLLETKVKQNKVDQLANKMFGVWQYITNLEHHYNGRIWITWKSNFYHIVPIRMYAQAVTCEVCYVPLQMYFLVTFVNGCQWKFYNVTKKK